MKRLLTFLIVLMCLAGCAKQELSAPEPQPAAPPAQTEVRLPEPEPAPEPERAPEPPAEETPKLPDLPEPVYCWNDTAVSPEGTVILQLPGHTLQPCYDAVSGEVRGILSFSNDNLWTSNGIYDLQGLPLATGSEPRAFGCAGDLMWYGGFRNYTVQRISDGEILASEVKDIVTMGDQVVLLPSIQFGSVVFLDSQTGAVTVAADRGFQPKTGFFQNGQRTYLAVSTPDLRKETVIDQTGRSLLDVYPYEVYDVQYHRAIVRGFENGQYVKQVIDLDTQEILFQTEHNVYLLPLPHSLLLEREGLFHLIDYRGNSLFDTPMQDFTIYDWKQDGTPEYIMATILREDRQCAVVLTPDGTEIAELPAERWQDVEPLSPTTLVYTVYTGEAALHQRAFFRNLETGEETILAEGTGLFVRQIETSGGHMIRCEVGGKLLLFLNDGTPARDDLGVCTYIGGDVFSCAEGLRCLDGSWLYRPEG